MTKVYLSLAHFSVGIFFFTAFVVIAQLFSGFLLKGIAPWVAVDSVCQWDEVSPGASRAAILDQTSPLFVS